MRTYYERHKKKVDKYLIDYRKNNQEKIIEMNKRYEAKRLENKKRIKQEKIDLLDTNFILNLIKLLGDE